MVIITSFKSPESPIRLQQTGVRAILDKKDLGVGTLFVSERSLCWQLADDKGFCIDYPQITLHAISKDAAVYSTECIYVLTDSHITLSDFEDIQANPVANGVNDQEADSSDSESEAANISEIVLAPENSALIPVMYEAIKVCQELNPDPDDMDDEDEEDNMFVDAEDMIEEEDGSSDFVHASEHCEINGDSNVNRLSEMMQAVIRNPNAEDQQFEDAD